MATDLKGTTAVDHRKLTRFVEGAFEKLGVPKADAEIGAKVLVLADLRGVDTHGVIRFNPQAWYVKWLTRRFDDCPAEHSNYFRELVNGAYRWRSWHGHGHWSPGDGTGDWQSKRVRDRHGRRAQQPPLRNVGLLFHDGVAARHDRHRHDQRR